MSRQRPGTFNLHPFIFEIWNMDGERPPLALKGGGLVLEERLIRWRLGEEECRGYFHGQLLYGGWPESKAARVCKIAATSLASLVFASKR